jgi:hypothetical protein
MFLHVPLINIQRSCEIRTRRTLLLCRLSVCRHVVFMETKRRISDACYVTMCARLSAVRSEADWGRTSMPHPGPESSVHHTAHLEDSTDVNWRPPDCGAVWGGWDNGVTSTHLRFLTEMHLFPPHATNVMTCAMFSLGWPSHCGVVSSSASQVQTLSNVCQ